MLTRSRLAFFAAVVSFASICQAQAPGKVDLEATEIAAELMGAPVFGADGAQVGEVADISFDEEGQARRLKIKTGAVLGFGDRTLEIPRGAFTVLRGAVVLDLPAEAVEALPQPAEIEDEK